MQWLYLILQTRSIWEVKQYEWQQNDITDSLGHNSVADIVLYIRIAFIQHTFILYRTQSLSNYLFKRRN